MFANLHAIAILGAVLVPLIAVGVNPVWKPRPLWEVVRAILPIMGIGIVFVYLLSATGVPVAEWVFPVIGVTVAGLFLRNPKAFEALRWSLFGLTIGLCLNSLALRSNEYASSTASRMYRALDNARLAALGGKLRDDFPPDRVLPPGTLAAILPQIETTEWELRKLQPTWHTLFTGLYQVTRTPCDAWYPGGPVATGSKQLQWRPKAMPLDVKEAPQA